VIVLLVLTLAKLLGSACSWFLSVWVVTRGVKHATVLGLFSLVRLQLQFFDTGLPMNDGRPRSPSKARGLVVIACERLCFRFLSVTF